MIQITGELAAEKGSAGWKELDDPKTPCGIYL
jgi:hypothetical protein